MQGSMNLMFALLLGSGAMAQHAVPIEDESEARRARIIRTSEEHLSLKKARSASPCDVWISGILLVPDDSMEDVELLVELDNGACDQARLRKNGRFDLFIPAGSIARLIYKKPHHITKEVLIDLSDLDQRSAQLKERKVEFDVILVHEKELPGIGYDGPVGSIDMIGSSRMIKVTHHERLIAMY